ncbi:amidohydrolase [Acidiferrimicrobium sp. IK]|uniref:amidohydrolase family protein n=1 Tax=Acidiferrimicrobium sp. IK TaxID=2871700 RepID=UPI0021CB07F7|nr:amidohydrolase family protein [Acidiferrimicrobium sp. IK]MCU4183492.1 amidohydrolase [Acidiferrimicrobium sp. IK]
MTLVQDEASAIKVDYGIYDADEHYYEAEDALTRHLDRSHRGLVRWADIEGRRTLVVNGKLVTVVPNPTYDPVGVPGSLEPYFRSENHSGKELRDIIKMHAIQPEYRSREARLARMDEQGVELAWLLPSLGLGLEEMLLDNPTALYAIFRAYNDWLDEDWGYDRDGRIQTGPLISLLDASEAEADVKRAIDRGARFITFRPAPVDIPGRPRSPGDPAYDRVWGLAADAGLVIAIHAADSGYGKYLANWGESQQYTGMKSSPLSEVMSVHIERPMFDMMAAMICHGVFDRHPRLRIASLELGGGWVSELIRRLKVSYGKTPQLFGRDPVESFREHVWVAPFYEDDICRVRDAIGADRILLGSDWPHPEGLSEPRAWIPDFVSLTPDEQRLALRENLKVLSGR